MMSKSIGQAGKPTGVVGSVFGRIMARHNRPDNEWTLELLQVDEGDSILEVGFGPGQAIKLLTAANPSAHVVGVDHSETMLSSAKRTNRREIVEGRVSLQRGSVEELPFPNATFDKAFSINCIYFWQDPLRGLVELHRVLKRAGRLAITVRDSERAAYKPFRSENVANLLRRANFSSVSAHHNGSQSHPLICAIGIK